MSASRFQRRVEQNRTVGKYLRCSEMRVSPCKAPEVGFGGIKVSKVVIGGYPRRQTAGPTGIRPIALRSAGGQSRSVLGSGPTVHLCRIVRRFPLCTYHDNISRFAPLFPHQPQGTLSSTVVVAFLMEGTVSPGNVRYLRVGSRVTSRSMKGNESACPPVFAFFPSPTHSNLKFEYT